MAHSSTGGTLPTKGRYPIQIYDRVPGGLHGDVGYFAHDRTVSAGWRMSKQGGNQQKGAPSATIVVVEQWVCLVLGLVCMAFGVWGLFMKPGLYALSATTAWLGSLFVPTLRATAVVCLSMGVVLVRRGWAHL